MPRIVQRRAKPPVKKEDSARLGKCGWCFGAAGAILPHNQCLGKRSTTFICTCTVCGYTPPPKEKS